jgi:hypothetical protein
MSERQLTPEEAKAKAAEDLYKAALAYAQIRNEWMSGRAETTEYEAKKTALRHAAHIYSGSSKKAKKG